MSEFNPFNSIDRRFDDLQREIQSLKEIIISGTVISPIINPSLPLQDQKFNIDELAAYLDTSRSTINRYKNNQAFPFYKVGRTVFFKKSEVDAAMSSETKKRGR
jgi:excisionase family DNA binding protein